jgi:soluble lytic murein transglycosylase
VACRRRGLTARGARWSLLAALSLLASSRPATASLAHETTAGELRTAYAALREGRAEEAEALFAALRDRAPILADHAERLRIDALAAATRHQEVVAAASRFTERHGASPVVGFVWSALGDAHRALGHGDEARAAWRRALATSREETRTLALTLASAETFVAEGRLEEAAAVLLEIWRDQPALEGAAEAERQLAGLESRLGRPLRGAADWAERSKGLAAAHHNEPALEACGRALRQGAALPTPLRDELALRRATLLFRLRRYAEAEKAYAALPTEPAHQLGHARSLARLGEIEASIEAFRAISAHARTAIGARALFLTATLLEDDDPAAAAAAYQRVAGEAPSAAARNEARWRLAWNDYREGDHARAAALLDRLIADTADPLDALRPRYWRARALETTDPEAARAQLARLARKFGFTYYGWRARQRLGLPEPSLPPFAEPTGSAGSLSAPRLQRVELLLAANLVAEAESELAALAPRARRRGERVRVASLYTAAGDFHRAQRLMVDHDLLPLARGPLPKDRREAWDLAWPRAFADELEPAAQRHATPPTLVYAVMREESGYRPRVLSVVGAHGLTQIMPSTGHRLAAQLGRAPLDPVRLLEPATNLDLGAYYLQRLLQQMDGRLAPAIASYNAGPTAVRRWLKREPELAEDVWVESIPYRQTRAYVKRVLRSVHVYRALHPGLDAAASTAQVP